MTSLWFNYLFFQAANLKGKILDMFSGQKVCREWSFYEILFLVLLFWLFNSNCKNEQINATENRSVLHVALRSPRDAVICSDGKNVMPEVWSVLDKISEFSERIRSGSWVRPCMLVGVGFLIDSSVLIDTFQVGVTGKPLKDAISVGIGGSYLGPLFVHTALQTGSEVSFSLRSFYFFLFCFSRITLIF